MKERLHGWMKMKQTYAKKERQMTRKDEKLQKDMKE